MSQKRNRRLAVLAALAGLGLLAFSRRADAADDEELPSVEPDPDEDLPAVDDEEPVDHGQDPESEDDEEPDPPVEDPDPTPGFERPGGFVEVPTGDEEDEEDAADPTIEEIVDPYPRGATFYQVRAGDRFLGKNGQHSIAYRYLLSEGYLAALENGLTHEQALDWAAEKATTANTYAVTDIIQCSGHNDALYGADKVAVSRAGPGGRSILLRPVHANNRTLIENGEAPVRNVTMGGNPSDPALREYEFLWLPAINRTVFFETNGATVTTDGQVWSDGSTKNLPPPAIEQLGYTTYQSVESLAKLWGCSNAQVDLRQD